MRRTLTIDFSTEEDELFKIYTQAEDLHYAMHEFEERLRRRIKDCDDEKTCEALRETLSLFFDCKEIYA